MNGIYVLSAVRTAAGKFGGSLRDSSAVDLGVVAARAALERAGVHPVLARVLAGRRIRSITRSALARK